MVSPAGDSKPFERKSILKKEEKLPSETKEEDFKVVQLAHQFLETMRSLMQPSDRFGDLHFELFGQEVHVEIERALDEKIIVKSPQFPLIDKKVFGNRASFCMALAANILELRKKTEIEKKDGAAAAAAASADVSRVQFENIAEPKNKWEEKTYLHRVELYDTDTQTSKSIVFKIRHKALTKIISIKPSKVEYQSRSGSVSEFIGVILFKVGNSSEYSLLFKRTIDGKFMKKNTFFKYSSLNKLFGDIETYWLKQLGFYQSQKQDKLELGSRTVNVVLLNNARKKDDVEALLPEPFHSKFKNETVTLSPLTENLIIALNEDNFSGVIEFDFANRRYSLPFKITTEGTLENTHDQISFKNFNDYVQFYEKILFDRLITSQKDNG